MYNLEKEVLNEILLRKDRNEMFTAYDITRILRSKIKTIINHDDVRTAVESQYKKAGFQREVAYHLPYSPPPQIYHQKGQDICNYDPNALDPDHKTAVIVSMCEIGMPSISLLSKSQSSLKVYALVEKASGLVVKNYSGRGGEFYLSKQGPNQMLRKKLKPDAYEIVEYKVTLEKSC